MSSQSFPDHSDITPFQQMVSSCSGAILTSLFGKVLTSASQVSTTPCTRTAGARKQQISSNFAQAHIVINKKRICYLFTL